MVGDHGQRMSGRGFDYEHSFHSQVIVAEELALDLDAKLLHWERWWDDTNYLDIVYYKITELLPESLGMIAFWKKLVPQQSTRFILYETDELLECVSLYQENDGKKARCVPHADTLLILHEQHDYLLENIFKHKIVGMCYWPTGFIDSSCSRLYLFFILYLSSFLFQCPSLV